MRYLLPLFVISLFLSSCGTTSRVGKRPNKNNIPVAKGQKIEEGIASWYGPSFNGKLTANGEQYDMHSLTAAHRTLPFNSIVKVKNLDNGRSVKVRINDRGPYAKNRIIDLSKEAAKELKMLGPGTAHVALYLVQGNLDDVRNTNLKVPTYTIQLASFDDETQAFEHSRKIRGARVVKARLNNKTVYRVYYGKYIDKNEAQKQQHKLERRGFDGYVKQLQN